MVDARTLEYILDWSRRNNAVVEVFFRETTFRLRIDKMFRAVDSSGNMVSWARAFGTKKPAELFSAFHVGKVVVTVSGSQQVLKDISELLRVIKGGSP